MSYANKQTYNEMVKQIKNNSITQKNKTLNYGNKYIRHLKTFLYELKQINDNNKTHINVLIIEEESKKDIKI